METQRTKLWRRLLKKTNEENVKLMVQISVMKNELKTKRIDLIIIILIKNL